jgi:hypothetical protein
VVRRIILLTSAEELAEKERFYRRAQSAAPPAQVFSSRVLLVSALLQYARFGQSGLSAIDGAAQRLDLVAGSIAKILGHFDAAIGGVANPLASFAHAIAGLSNTILRFVGPVADGVASLFITAFQIAAHLPAGFRGQQKTGQGSGSQADEKESHCGSSVAVFGRFVASNAHDRTSRPRDLTGVSPNADQGSLQSDSSPVAVFRESGFSCSR